jgi:ribosomal protein S18 acetylase RimI-like enzyme
MSPEAKNNKSRLADTEASGRNGSKGSGRTGKSGQAAKPRKPGRLRLAELGDYFEISQLSGLVFSPYGDYRQVLPDYLFCEDVATYLWEKRGALGGFIQVGLKPVSAGTGVKMIAEILSVAVHPNHQNQGVGRALFEKVFQALEPLKRTGRLLEIRLTVAHTNDRAKRFFRHLGFTLTDADLGYYAGGQRALRMTIRPSETQT